MKFQPTYMAAISFFWQLYVSSVSGDSEKNESMSDAQLRVVFDEIDIDKVDTL
jgi:hypothetical protein